MNKDLQLRINDLSLNSLQELFRTSMKTLNAGVWEVDPATGRASWDENFNELLGYGPDELSLSMDHFLEELIHPADKETFLKQYEEQILSIRDFSTELRIKCKNNDYRWFRATGGFSRKLKNGKIKIVGLIIDIHDSKCQTITLEEEVQKNKEILEILEQTQNYARIGSWQVNIETMESYWSEMVYHIHEVEPGTHIDVESAIHYYRKDFRPIIQKAVDACIQEQQPYDLECVIITGTGKEIWVRTMGYPYYENDDLTGIRGLFMDIDHEKRTTIENEFLSVKFESIFNSTYNFTGLIEPDGTLLDANRSALEFGGFTLADVCGKKFHNAPWWSLNEEIRDKLIRSIQKASKGEFIRYDADVVGADGQVITIDFSLSPIFNDNGEVIYIVPEGRNISRRKSLEKELSLRETQLRKFVEAAPFAVAMFDTELKYITLSEKWYSTYGIEDDNIIGKHHYDIFPEIGKNEEWKGIHQQALKGKSFTRKKELFIRQDGSQQWIFWKIIPWYQKAGEIGGIMMYTIDITEQIEYESKLLNINELLEESVQKRTKELNRAIEDLESFSYSVSHDLRAPLRSVNSFADILMDEYSSDLEGDALRYLKIIKDNGLRMGQLIDDILSFSRLGRKDLIRSDVNINELFNDVVNEIEKSHPEYNSSVTIEDMPVVRGDASLLKQVVFNLLSNAFKYSSVRDLIEISISSKTEPSQIVFCIKDNGVGFDMKYHNKMFGVFQRLHSDSEFSGTGVGLAIVKKIINKHGGKVWAESSPGDGSFFYFSIPNT